jgi:hypothetical protein
MKRKKKDAVPEAVPEAELRPAKTESVVEVHGPVRATGQCVVCGSDVAPFSDEDLCWVCRRLKISAWRDSEVQPTAPE